MTANRLPARLAGILLATVLAVVGTATAALAVWSGSGNGSWTARTATLGTPTGVTASADATAVTVSWTAPADRPAGAVLGYRVTEVSSGTAVCGSGSPVQATSCTWTAPAAGFYSFRVTAVLRSWSSTSAASTAVPVNTATRLVVTTPARSGTASATPNLGPVTVQLQDASGKPASAATATTVGLSSDTARAAVFSATAGGPATTSLTVPAGSSSVSFYYGDTAAGSPRVTATSVFGTVSQVQTVTAGPASRLAFVQQPTSVVVNRTITPAPAVAVQDAFGNRVASTSTVSIALGGGPANGRLNGDTSVSAVNGLATFDDLSVNRTGTYTLTASRSGLTAATSAPFPVTAAASRVVFTSAAVSGPAGAGASLGPITVALQDGSGNDVAAADDTTVKLSASTGTGVFSTTRNGTATTTVTIPAGSATATFWFGATRAGSVVVTASASGLSSGSQTETVTAAAPAQLVWAISSDPSSSSTDCDTDPNTCTYDDFGRGATLRGNVGVADAFGNLVSNLGTPVTVTLAAPQGGSVTPATVSVPATGSATSTTTFTFTSQVSNSWTTHVLTASAPGLTQARITILK